MTVNFKRSLRSKPWDPDVSPSASHVGRRRRRMLASCALVTTAGLVAGSLTTSSDVFGSTPRSAQAAHPELTP